MQFIARQKRGVTPTQVEVVWDRGNGFSTVISDSVCQTIIGDLKEPKRNEIAAMLESAPQMLELLRSIAMPKRGSEEEGWTVNDMALRASRILMQIEKTEKLLP